MKELTGALRKSNVRQASYLGARLASFDKNNDGHISIGELGKWKTPRYVLPFAIISSVVNDTF